MLGLLLASPGPAHAEPDPLLAGLLSTASTVVPIGLGSSLLLTGRGANEGIRFDLGLSSIALGAALGPSVGQIYARGGKDAWVTFGLRTLTSAIMVTGLGLRLRGGESIQGAGTALAVVGGIPTTFLGIYDIFASASSARQRRYEAGHAPMSSVVLPPETWRLASHQAPDALSRCGDGRAADET